MIDMTKDPYLEMHVLTADPLDLIHMLYQRALDLVDEARRGLRSGDVATRGTAIVKAVAILGELEGSLDHAVGGEMSRRLAALYRYMEQRLTVANGMRQDAPLAEVERLLKTLAEAWSGIRPAAMAMPTPAWGGQPGASEMSSADQGWSA
jgi:flagellar protein FliS